MEQRGRIGRNGVEAPAWCRPLVPCQRVDPVEEAGIGRRERLERPRTQPDSVRITGRRSRLEVNMADVQVDWGHGSHAMYGNSPRRAWGWVGTMRAVKWFSGRVVAT